MKYSKVESGLTASPSKGVELTEMEGEGILYSHEQTKMLYLNDSALVVWQLCDGHRTVAEIVDLLASEFADMQNEVRLEVPDLIENFVDEGVLELVAK
jgi:hypothetical protein